MKLADGDECPGCGADLRGPEIPQEYREKGWYGDRTHYSRVLGVEYSEGPERYDGVSEWVCPDCGRREGRWTGRHLTGTDVEPRFGGTPTYGTDAA